MILGLIRSEKLDFRSLSDLGHFSRRFWRKVNDSYIGQFFKVRFFVHLFKNLNYGCSKHTRNIRTSSKTKNNQNRRPEPRKHTWDPPLYWCFSLNRFSAHWGFVRKYLECTKGPLHFFDNNRMNVKNPKGSPLYIFRHNDTVQKSYFGFFYRNFFRKFLEIFLMPSSGSPFQLFSYFETNWIFKDPKGPPFTTCGIGRFFKMNNFVSKFGFLCEPARSNWILFF